MNPIDPLIRSIGISAGIFLIFVCAAFLVRFIMSRWLQNWARETSTTVDDRILVALGHPLFYIILIYGMDYAISRLPFDNRLIQSFRGLIFILGIVVVTTIVYRMAMTLLEWYGEKLRRRASTTNLVREFIPLTKRITSIAIFTLAVIVVLKHFNYDAWSLLTAMGVGSLAIGLAAKETLTNMISGFSIMIDRPFRPGDRIELASGEIGDVQEIGLRSTRIKTFDNTILVVPNTALVNASLVNYCYPDFKVKVRIRVGIAYGSDIEKAKRIMLDTTREVPSILQDPPPSVYFTEFGDSSLNLLMIFWVVEYTQMLDAKDRVNSMIHERFAKEGIEIPFPIQTVFLKK